MVLDRASLGLVVSGGYTTRYGSRFEVLEETQRATLLFRD